MLRFKVALIASGIVAVVFLGFSAAAVKVEWLQREGTPSFIAVVTLGSWLTFVLLLLELRREKRDRDKTLLIKTLADAVPAQSEAPPEERTRTLRAL